MSYLSGKKLVVIGGSRGVGRRIVEDGVRQGARVLAVGRREATLQQLAREVPGVDILALDASREDAPARVFDVLTPDILVLAAGVFPPAAPIHRQTWQEFAVNWEADVKMAFHFCKAALLRPLPSGASVFMISSGAALAGSPNSGGYAGAKKTQLFIANYSQKEADRMGLPLHFIALTPRMMPETDLGRGAVAGYADYLGLTPEAFVAGMATPPTPSDVAAAVFALGTDPGAARGRTFIVSGDGFEPAP